jgi:pyruvate dehydrogenase E1 component beta subunit
MNGMRPIVEIMTCNFSLLALDQIVNNAATLLHMSGGQFNVPLVIRTTAGAGRQLAAQHSHSFEPIFAHVPGIRVVSIATHEDARGMLWTALRTPTRWSCSSTRDHNVEAELPGRRRPGRPRPRRDPPAGTDVTLVTYGATLHKVLEAAEELAEEGIDAEVIDLRTLRPLDDATVLARSRGPTAPSWSRRLATSASGPRSRHGSARRRSTTSTPRSGGSAAPRCRSPYAKHLEEAALPQVPDDRRAVHRVMHRG